MNKYSELISKNIRKYRIAAGMTQIQLAKKLGITSASISNWEKGQNSIDVEMLFKLCEVLNVSIDAMGNVNRDELSQEDITLLNRYHQLDTYGKKAVDETLNRELERCQDQDREKEEEIS